MKTKNRRPLNYKQMVQIVHARTACEADIDAMMLTLDIDPNALRQMAKMVGIQAANDEDHRDDPLEHQVSVAFSMGFELGAMISHAIGLVNMREAAGEES